jgi:hypothetical protein
MEPRPEGQTERCVECLRAFPSSEVMRLGDMAVCAQCKPGAVAKVGRGELLGRLWRSGSLLVALRSPAWVECPSRCIVCNVPATERRVPRNAIWVKRGWWLTVLLTPLVFFAVTYCIGLRVQWLFGFCEDHWKQRKREESKIMAVIALSVLLAAGGIMLLDSWMLLARPALGVAAIIHFDRRRLELRLQRATATHAFFHGCGPEFLAQFPEWPEAR